MYKSKLIQQIVSCFVATFILSSFVLATSPIKTLGVVVFPHFELLDVFGPLEMFGQLPDNIRVVVIAEKKGPVSSDQGTQIVADTDFEHAPHIDYLFVPGGWGTRTEIKNKVLLNWLKQRAQSADLILGVCTGSALLAKVGVLDHHQATTNKLAFDWAVKQGPQVTWIKSARWVDDGRVITSSGVAAGIDMSLHVIARLYGVSKSREIASSSEYVWNSDALHDPFAKK